MKTKSKILIGVLLIISSLFFVGKSLASTINDLQPAEDIEYGERLRIDSAISVSKPSYFYGGMHLNGVLFANNTIINGTDSDGKPVTIGDGFRVDGELQGGPSKGTGDGLPLKVSDSMIPTATNMNNLGDSNRRWRDMYLAGTLFGEQAIIGGELYGGSLKGVQSNDDPLYISDTVLPTMDNINDFGNSDQRWRNANFSGDVAVGNLLGSGVIHPNNLAVSTTGTAGQVLSVDSSGDFEWITIGTSGSSVGDITAVAAGTGINVSGGSSGDATVSLNTTYTDNRYVNVTGDDMTGKLSISGSIDSSGGLGGTPGQLLEITNSSGSSSIRGLTSTVSNTSGSGSVAGYFQNDGLSGTGIYSVATNTSGSVDGGRFIAVGEASRGIYAVAVSTSGVNYGGHFSSSSSGGYGVYGSGNTGVYGVSTSGYGIHGVSTSSYAIYGASTSSYGVHGSSTSSYGVYGSGATGIYGYSNETNGYGVYGINNGGVGSSATGVQGESTSGTAVGGLSTNGTAVRGVIDETTVFSSYSGYFNGGNFYVSLEDSTNYNFTINNLAETGTGNSVNIDASGNLFEDASSIRYKKDVADLEVDTAKVLELNPVSFRYKRNDQEDIGLIAEDVNEIIPDLVNYDKEGLPNGVKYDRISVYLLEIIKEQQERINSLEETNNNQEEEIDIIKEAFCNKYPEESICE